MKLGVRVDRERLDPIQPLVVPVTPAPGESLAGLVARSTRRNVLRYPRIILAEVGIDVWGTGSVGIDVEGLEARLAAKLGCTTEDIHARASPFVPGTSNMEVRRGNGSISRFDLRLRHRWISPATFAVSGVHLAAWENRLLPFCPHSLELLISTCPTCLERLSWLAAWGVGTCERCRTEVVHPDGETLDPSLVAGYRTFSHLVSMDPSERDLARASLVPEIAALSTKSLVRLVINLGRICRADVVPQHNVGLMNPGVIADVVSLGTELIHDFPGRLRATIVEEIDRVGWDLELPLRSRLRSIRSLASPNLQRSDQIDLIRSAIPEVFQPKGRSFGGLRAPIMLLRDIQRLTNINLGNWERVVEARAVQFSLMKVGRRSQVQYDEASVMDFIARREASASAASIQWDLGVPRYAIEQLLCQSELRHEDHPAISLLHKGLRIADAQVFIRSLAKAARRGKPPRDAIRLSRAVARIGGRPKPWGAILTALRKRDLKCWLATQPSRKGEAISIPFIDRVMVLPSAIAQFDGVTFDEADHPAFDHFSAEISRTDAEELMNVTSQQMSEIIANGGVVFRKGPGKSHVTSKADVLQLAAAIVGTAELCMRTGAYPQGVGKQMDGHGIDRRPPGWCRVSLIRKIPHLYPELPPGDAGANGLRADRPTRR